MPSSSGSADTYNSPKPTLLAYPPLKCPRYTIELPAERTIVMGVLNVTPDSFSDGGKFHSLDHAVVRVQQMVEEGADIIDIGGESTRPGAAPVSVQEECARIIPVIQQIADKITIPISVDTHKAEVAKNAIHAGAQMINDITALNGDPAMAELAAVKQVPIIFMHMQGTPQTMQTHPEYQNLISEVTDYLNNAILKAKNAGIKEDQIVIDPGIGFGKTVAHNVSILRRLSEFLHLNRPILIGVSRKSFIGKILDLPVEERIEGTAAAVAIAIMNGAKIVRVHDVKEMLRVVKIADAIRSSA